MSSESSSPEALEFVEERMESPVERENMQMLVLEENGGGEFFFSSDREEENMEENEVGELMNYEEPSPLQINDSLSEQEIEDRASLWVQANVLQLSELFGAAFEGCDKVTFDLFLRIDRKRGELKEKETSVMSSGKRSIPKEIKNLEFHVKFKEGEPRNRGRTISANNQ